MTSTDLRTNLQRLCSRLGLTALTLTTLAACIYLGYTLHGVVEQTRFDQAFAEGVSITARALGSFFAMDPTIALVLVPALVVGCLALGGMYLWARRA